MFNFTLLNNPSPGPNDLLSVMDAPASCGYDVNLSENKLYVPFTGCNVKSVADCHVSELS